jgi:hypothetical protein
MVQALAGTPASKLDGPDQSAAWICGLAQVSRHVIAVTLDHRAIWRATIMYVVSFCPFWRTIA